MEKIAVNPNRLMWCCETFGIDISELSVKVYISQKTLQAALENEAVITIIQLRKLADFFNRTMLFFLNPNDVQVEKILSPQFRTMNDHKPIHSPKIRRFIERVEQHRKIYLGLLEDIDEDIIEDWYPHELTLDVRNIRDSANNIRQWLNLREGISFGDLRNAAESKGIIVIVSNPFNGDWQISKKDPVRGFSQFYDIYPIIVIKKQSPGAQAFTLMHELAHLLLHKNSVIDFEEDFHFCSGQEKEANEFAGNVLIPIEFLEQINIEYILELAVNDYDNYLNQFSDHWCVSNETIIVRLVKEKFIKYSVYEEYKRFKDAIHFETESRNIPRAYRYREPINVFGSHYVGVVFEAFNNKHITLAKTSTYLDNLKINDIHKLIDHGL